MLSTCTLIEYILFNLLHFLYFSTPRSVVLRKTHIGVLYIFFLLSLLIVIKKNKDVRENCNITHVLFMGWDRWLTVRPCLILVFYLFVCFFGGRGLGAFVVFFLIYLLVYFFIYIYLFICLFAFYCR